jgi:peptidoglycan/xylan/chitin deacetylase (PgdA/CDA1 family)
MFFDKELLFSLSPFKGFYRAAVAISFDYETSAIYGNIANLYSKIRGMLFKISNRFTQSERDLSFCYGLGYTMRRGANNVLNILDKYNVHATWFSTGHVLLKDNRNKKAYRINQILPYAITAAGFTRPTTWRRHKPTFYYEPFGDYKKYPYWYFGDQAEQLREWGEDIQCHTFSHPYIAMESAENVELDIEDWQDAAERNGFKKAKILSFPYCGDAYRYYYNLDLKAMIGKDIPGENYHLIKIDSTLIDIFKKNGIEIVTRCGSKFGKYESISQYDDLMIDYMSDMPCSGHTLNFDLFKNRIKKIIEAEAAVNIWMHPCNVFTKKEVAKFDNLIRFLITQHKDGKIWFATISEIWEHCKKVRYCKIDIISRENRFYEIRIINCNAKSIENLTVDLDSTRLQIMRYNRNCTMRDRKIAISKLQPGEVCQLIFKIRQ